MKRSSDCGNKLLLWMILGSVSTSQLMGWISYAGATLAGLALIMCLILENRK